MSFFQPLSVYFVWHPLDEEKLKPYIEYNYQLLSKNVDKPFSRSMNLPVFFRTSCTSDIPETISIKSEKTIVFLFVSKEVGFDDKWVEYLKQISANVSIKSVPIAIDTRALSLSRDFGNINFIRAYDFQKEYYKENLFIAISHEIFRYSLNDTFTEKRPGKDNSIKLFISHAKDRAKGIHLAEELKNYIDNSSMRNFFDTTDIAPGYRFDTEIENHIKESTIISINSDIYSSRYWCQREILCAKNFERPIIAVDILDEFEDRRFPYSSNIPCVHADINDGVGKKDILRILTVTLLETIRFNYSKIMLGKIKEFGLVDADTAILPRPPEAYDVHNILINENGLLRKTKEKILYPEPPLYSEEIEYLEKIGIIFMTPLSINSIDLHNKKIGLSISAPSDCELISKGISGDVLTRLSQELSRHLIARNAELIYGGDIRPGGFTQFIFEEAMALNASMNSDTIRITNYIAWPIYNSDSDSLKEWKCKYRHIAKMINVPFPEDVKDLIPNGSENAFLMPINAQNSYVWGRSLTNLRYKLIENSDIRIVAGGTHVNYKGRMPGVLEEVLIAIKNKKPLFLLGGFGGVTSSVCEMIENKQISQKISKEWQLHNQSGYKELLDIYEKNNTWDDYNYDDLEKILKIENLKNGLTEEENYKLFNTQFIDEAIYIILNGIKNLFNTENKKE